MSQNTTPSERLSRPIFSTCSAISVTEAQLDLPVTFGKFSRRKLPKLGEGEFQLTRSTSLLHLAFPVCYPVPLYYHEYWTAGNGFCVNCALGEFQFHVVSYYVTNRLSSYLALASCRKLSIFSITYCFSLVLYFQNSKPRIFFAPLVVFLKHSVSF